MYPDLAIVYRILRSVALRERQLSMPGLITYSELSQQYELYSARLNLAE